VLPALKLRISSRGVGKLGSLVGSDISISLSIVEESGPDLQYPSFKQLLLGLSEARKRSRKVRFKAKTPVSLLL